ncbi:MAG TPA: recombination mediator RecR [Candidatus Krumholzibacteriaceae bacterium]|nr:recombination mediator RecR [Candidatus Krumholzibacteriaceae bacterium]
MSYELQILRALIDHFRKMPGIGEKTARRLAFSILYMGTEEVKSFAKVLLRAKEKVRFCKICGNLAESETCQICEDSSRDGSVVCVVERPADLYVLEKTGRFRGRYHVLHGVLSPLDGVGPEDLNLKGLQKRVEREGIKELIIATNPSVEGDTTALYINELFKDSDVKITRPARGIPLGSTLEFIDGSTLSKAIESREPI